MNTKLQTKINKLNIKIDLMKKKITLHDMDNINDKMSHYDNTNKKIQEKNYNEPLNLLINFEIPENLDFRNLSLKKEYSELFNDIVERGQISFV